MKYCITYIAVLLIVIFIPSVKAAESCEIPLRVITISQTEDIPEATIDFLNSRLANAVATDGIIASETYGQFFISAKFNHITEDVVAGPPRQFAVHTVLTLMIGEIDGKQIYNTKTFELRGVGTSKQRAIINSLQGINARNELFMNFVKAGKEKIIGYFDSNYKKIIARAENAAMMRNYEEALYYASGIPECCIGYASAAEAVVSIFKSFLDYDSEILYKKAVAAWIASPNAAGAQEASLYLSLIDSTSSDFVKAQELADEIKMTVRGDFTFEHRDKYNDTVALKKAYIDAARQIGVAYGNGQKQSTTNLFMVK